MKKVLLFISILVTLNSFSYTRISSDEYLKGIFTSKSVKDVFRNDYDYNNDLAIISDRLSSESEAKLDAVKGIKESIIDYSNTLLYSYLREAGVTGRGFDTYTMRIISNDIANKFINNDENLGVKTILIDDSQKYITLLKISRNIIEKEAKKEFRIRLNNLIHKLNDYYLEIE